MRPTTSSFTPNLWFMAMLCSQTATVLPWLSSNTEAQSTAPEIWNMHTPCPDSTNAVEGDAGGFWGGGGVTSGWLTDFGEPGYEECDPDENALFGNPLDNLDHPEHDEKSESAHAKARAAFTVNGAPGHALRRTLRHRAAVGDWSHDVTVRDDTLTRRRFTWSSARTGRHDDGTDVPIVRMSGGDLTDTTLRIWPRGLPRRPLPAGWSAAAGTPERPQTFSAPVPQGAAVGVLHDGWSAWAAHAWNPVSTRTEPPWLPAWTLRHAGLGATIPLNPVRTGEEARGRPWTLTLLAAQTRITRTADALRDAREGTVLHDSLMTFEAARERALSERTLAAEVMGPTLRSTGSADNTGSTSLTFAWNERDLWGEASGSRGVLTALNLSRRFRLPSLTKSFETGEEGIAHSRAKGSSGSSLTLGLTARQRTAGWASAWDPAVPVARAQPTSEEPDETESAMWGAGEARMAAQWRQGGRRGGRGVDAFAEKPALDRATVDLSRAWNPSTQAARTTVRGGTGLTLEHTRFDLSATRRVTRSASGTRSLYHYARAEAQQTTFPRARLAAWRAWDAAGPTRTGFYGGAAPVWDATLAGAACELSPEAGLQLEKTNDWPAEVWTTRATAGLSLRGATWSLSGLLETQRGSSGHNEGLKWRLLLTLGR